ncbi:MAG TPA: penicillin-binding transpeptidase domain-containing protein [Candidatus Corynebacterium gallistercoris]|uniref:Penicillin-binding transpeptidase domain-containing protein n=1 Tax=Candidatus Corynebacterium gallistercoris TaxID=2838530 RepID=A0A9D1S0W0_9CORY|nr:penicillin-binding transpeptidase domain-containing protein [Candidatus Corynebacterium gallistercoris]
MLKIKPVVASVVAVGLVCSVGACTPRPDNADNAAQEFLDELAGRQAPGEDTDNPAVAQSAIDKTWDSLQAEGLQVDLREVHTAENQATATYNMRWDLPGDRHVEYESSMMLTKTAGDWTVRWQPAILHPDLGANQHLELRQVPAQMANVVGSDGAVLLEPGRQWRVFVDTSKTASISSTMRRIAAELSALHAEDDSVPTIDPEAKAAEAKGVRGEYSVVTVNAVAGAKLKETLEGESGIRLNEEAALVRPDPSLAPDILSRVSRIVEDDLEGDNGWKVVAATAEGAEVSQIAGEDPQLAGSVHVSLSRKVQEAAQAAVDTRSDAKTMMVVMRPSTGEILAVAQTAKADEDGNVALMGQYPPGSTFKMLTAYAGLEKQGLTPDSTVGCPGTQNIGGRIVTNYNGFSLGSTALETAFARSCNTTFADISTQLAPGELKDIAANFGLGADFAIDGLDTLTGSVPEGEVMLDRTEAGYGQGLDLTSPFGMSLVAATAAAGKRPTPYLIAGDEHRTEVGGEKSNPLNPEHIAELQRMMRTVVTSGTATAIAGAGEVHGKTGEAEINEGSHAWFAGYRGDLAFATLVVLGGGSEHAVGVTNHFFANLDGQDQ